MKKAFLLILVISVLVLLSGCELLKGISTGYTVSGTISFSSFTRSVAGELRTQLFSTTDPTGAPAADLAPQTYSGEQQVSFAFDGVQQGGYRVQAYIDRNANSLWDEGEPIGSYPSDAANDPVLMSVNRDTVMDLVVWADPIPVTIVYNDPADISIANEIEALLESTLTTVPGVAGAMPLFAVTKIRDMDIPSTPDPAFALPGAPIIITPNINSSVALAKNVAQTGHGIIAMGSGGAGFLGFVSAGWSGWGFAGQEPDEIGIGSSTFGSALEVKTRGTASGAWSSPLQSAGIPSVDGVLVPLASAAIPTVEVISVGGVDPVEGALLAENKTIADQFPIARQGRCLQYGFDGLADLPQTGSVLFVNLVKMMSAY